MARLFVAVRPPPSVVDVLRAVPREPTAALRWIDPEQWHVTLRFVGEAAAADVSSALDALRHPSVTARLGPSVRRLGDRHLVVDVGGLDSLAAAVRAVTAPFGDAVDSHPFVGHLTLARGRGVGRVAKPAPAAAVRIAECASVVEEIALIRSDLRPEGARHTTVSTHRLVV